MKTITKNKKKTKAKIIETLFVATLIAYPLFHFGVFWVYINFRSIFSTFQKFNPLYNEYTWAGLENYTRIFKEMILGEDVALHNMFINSFKAITINVIILPIAVFSAYAFYKKMPGHKFYRVMFYIPQLISIVVMTMIFRYMFHAEFGPISMLAATLTGQESVDFLSVSSPYLWTIVCLYCIWTGLGSNVIMMRDAMTKIPCEVQESAILDGCGFFRELWSITIPLCMSTISIYIVNIVMAPISFTMAPMLIAQSMGSNGAFGTIGWMIFSNANKSPGTQITMTTMGVLFTLLLTPFVLLTKFITKKLTPEL